MVLEAIYLSLVQNSLAHLQLLFQQDGATCHTTNMVREWLAEKFGQRVISRLTARPWQAKSPCLSPLDYWFWSVCLLHIIVVIMPMQRSERYDGGPSPRGLAILNPVRTPVRDLGLAVLALPRLQFSLHARAKGSDFS